MSHSIYIHIMTAPKTQHCKATENLIKIQTPQKRKRNSLSVVIPSNIKNIHNNIS